MRDQLAKELENIGLSEKEAKVYLAALELGPSTAQAIAAKATVNRSNTYVMIEQLIKRGLMSSFEKGKKRFFEGGPPHQLLYLINVQKKNLLEKEDLVRKLIEKIGKITEKNENHSSIVNVYEGVDGMNVLQNELLNSDAKEILELTSVDKATRFLPEMFPNDIREKICKSHKVRSLYTSSRGPLPPATSSTVESRILDEQNSIQGELIVFGKKAALTSYNDHLKVVIINEPDITATLSTLFDSLWKLGKKDN